MRACFARLVGSALALGVASTGCLGTPGSSPLAVSTPEPTDGLTRCKLAARSQHPLVTEWAASEKANLEASLARGAMVVAYSGCELRLLPGCTAPGNYAFRRTTVSTDVLEIRGADELYAKLPLGAVQLEGELERSGRLSMRTTVAGQLELRGFDVQRLSQSGACTGATHVLAALSVGAYDLSSGGDVRASGGASVAGVGDARGGTSRSESLLRRTGLPERCGDASETAPARDCAAPIQVFLEALPSELSRQAPPGRVRALFRAPEAANPWDVMIGERAQCRTPCELMADPNVPYRLRHETPWYERNRWIDVPDLTPYKDSPAIQVDARPLQQGQLATGIVGTSLGGMAVLTGIVLAAVGCGSDGRSASLCTPGIITIPLGLGVGAGGIWLMLDARSRVTITEAR